MTMKNGVAVNPGIDEVVKQVTWQIQESCKPVPIDKEAIDDWVTTYKTHFSDRLHIAVWDVEKKNVLNAAEQHGIIAKAIASLRGTSHVDKDILREASKVVVKNCDERFGAVGVWCS
jgi:hypothetical protein